MYCNISICIFNFGYFVDLFCFWYGNLIMVYLMCCFLVRWLYFIFLRENFYYYVLYKCGKWLIEW